MLLFSTSISASKERTEKPSLRRNNRDGSQDGTHFAMLSLKKHNSLSPKGQAVRTGSDNKLCMLSVLLAVIKLRPTESVRKHLLEVLIDTGFASDERMYTGGWQWRLSQTYLSVNVFFVLLPPDIPAAAISPVALSRSRATQGQS